MAVVSTCLRQGDREAWSWKRKLQTIVLGSRSASSASFSVACLLEA
jgi:hypothetical protein